METALALFRSSGASDVVEGKHVVEAGSPTLTGDTPVSEQGWVVHADTSVSVPDAEARTVTSNSTIS